MISIRRIGPRERVVRPWPPVWIDLRGRHPRVRKDEIWQAGIRLARGCRK